MQYILKASLLINSKCLSSRTSPFMGITLQLHNRFPMELTPQIIPCYIVTMSNFMRAFASLRSLVAHAVKHGVAEAIPNTYKWRNI